MRPITRGNTQNKKFQLVRITWKGYVPWTMDATLATHRLARLTWRGHVQKETIANYFIFRICAPPRHGRTVPRRQAAARSIYQFATIWSSMKTATMDRNAIITILLWQFVTVRSMEIVSIQSASSTISHRWRKLTCSDRENNYPSYTINKI